MTQAVFFSGRSWQPPLPNQSEMEKMKITAETTTVQAQSLRFSAVAKAAMKQDELNVAPNALENLTHALRFR